MEKLNEVVVYGAAKFRNDIDLIVMALVDVGQRKVVGEDIILGVEDDLLEEVVKTLNGHGYHTDDDELWPR